MPTATIAPDVELAPVDLGGEACHYYCCDPDTSLCGVDITDDPECPEDCGGKICEPCERVAHLPCVGFADCWKRGGRLRRWIGRSR